MTENPRANMTWAAQAEARRLVQRAAAAAMEKGTLPQGELPPFVVEIPADTSHGDFAVNAAMVSAKVFRMGPPKIAAALLEEMDFTGTCFHRAESAGPGFLNFFLTPDWFSDVLLGIGELGEDYGRTDYGKGQRVLVEFVSANPTGPMHMGNARGGAIGDTLAAALDAAGYSASREFYINDAGNQIDKFGLSLEARYLQLHKGEDAVPFPEDGYHGEDIAERAGEFAEIHGDGYVECDSAQRQKALVDYALPRNIQKLKDDLAVYRISFDTWYPESLLHRQGVVDMVVDKLTKNGLTYEQDGALWYRATAYGAEKDEVLIRQNGNATYFAADIAYHYDKLCTRGFSQAINIWGADHHGHVARLKGAMDAVGLSGDRLEIVLMQLVRLMKNGEPYRMSKRSGKSISLSDLLELVPVDAARFLFNMREPGSAMDFDLDLAVAQDSQNPVYYVQYAHARVCSIFKNLREEGVSPRACGSRELQLLNRPEERELTRQLARYPGEIIGAATRRDPACLTRYAVDVAGLFHKFYSVCRVKVEDEALMQARMHLCTCVGVTLRNLLALMKIDAPESM